MDGVRGEGLRCRSRDLHVAVDGHVAVDLEVLGVAGADDLHLAEAFEAFAVGCQRCLPQRRDMLTGNIPCAERPDHLDVAVCLDLATGVGQLLVLISDETNGGKLTCT